MKIEVTYIENPVTQFERDHPFRVTLGPGAGGRYIQRAFLTDREVAELREALSLACEVSIRINLTK
jgi:hypothetical protein